VAVTNPDAIAIIHVDPVDGLTLSAAREWVERANLDEEARDQAAELLVNCTPATPRVTATWPRSTR